MLKYTTAGESHGKALITLIEGLPAGLEISEEYINQQLKRRQKGYGRGGRMAIETDQAEIMSGVRAGKTTGAPVTLMIKNRDWENWQDIMAVESAQSQEKKAVKRPRPGHADLPGAIKYQHSDMRNVLERASARETASRVAAGAFFRKFLEEFNIYIYSQVLSIGSVKSNSEYPDFEEIQSFQARLEESSVRCADKQNEGLMMQEIDQAKKDGESLGGVFEITAAGVVPGLGSHVSWEQRLDSKLSGLLIGIPAIKAVEIGEGIEGAFSPGSKVHDEIRFSDDKGIYRMTNRAGGIEGGISNGERIWARAYMKPIPTLYKPLLSVNTGSWSEEKADIERSDICAVPAAAVVGEAMFSYGIAGTFMEKFSGDFMEQISESYEMYIKYLKKVWKWEKI